MRRKPIYQWVGSIFRACAADFAWSLCWCTAWPTNESECSSEWARAALCRCQEWKSLESAAWRFATASERALAREEAQP